MADIIGENMLGKEKFPDILKKIISILTGGWCFLMLAVFPLYAPEKYQGLGDYKFSFFLNVSKYLLLPALILAVVYLGLLRWGKKKTVLPGRKAVSITDIGVLLYLFSNLISYLYSSFKEVAWEGIGGWNMGLKTQLLMIAAYVLVSRFGSGRMWKVVVSGAAAGTALAFILGILHRFDVDPLGMYTGIAASYKIWFLSTLGQATWYSSFVCTVLPVGVCLFCFSGMSGRDVSDRCNVSKQKRLYFRRTAAGLWCIFGFMTLVTQNSDSAFAALGVLFLCLFLICCFRLQWLKRFTETLMLAAASFALTGLLQHHFSERVIPLGKLSILFSQGSISWILFLGTLMLYLVFVFAFGKRKRRLSEKRPVSSGEPKMEQLWNRCRKKVQIIALSVFLLGLLLLVAVISWNTKNAAAGGSFMIGKGSYLIFDHSWGSNRGFTWKTTAKIFAEMPFLNQVLGAGPDCYYPYSYTVSAYAQTLHDFWKPDILTNAHNEFLNLLICLGGFGLLSWLILLFGSGWRFVQAGRKNPIVFAGTLTICAYAAHNFFCYQQVCCTPFLFLILGFAENLSRNTDSFS